jgi:tetratricopeptide (TPR) repeat protein
MATLGYIFIASKNKKEVIPTLKERAVQVSLQGEWLNTKNAVATLLDKIKVNPNDNKAKLQLAMAYIQEGRVTGDHDYYDEASVKLLNQVLSAEPKNFDAMCCKATVLLSQHHFQDGLKIAQEAVKINPSNAFVYGILCDANVELGNYDEAVKMADKMSATRPDLRSYTRVSYLREIFGDNKGAIDAMRMALESGYPALEQTEWTRCQLGHLYENNGDTLNAAFQYKKSLSIRENYPYALMGIGRLEKAKKNYKLAISYFEQAQKMIKDYAIGDELTDLYLLNNEKEKSVQNAQNVILMLKEHANSEDKNPDEGHYADKELAYSFLKINNVEEALKCAIREYNRRPENIEANETLAWCFYKKGDITNAKKYIAVALKTNCKKAELLERAKEINGTTN